MTRNFDKIFKNDPKIDSNFVKFCENRVKICSKAVKITSLEGLGGVWVSTTTVQAAPGAAGGIQNGAWEQCALTFFTFFLKF